MEGEGKGNGGAYLKGDGGEGRGGNGKEGEGGSPGYYAFPWI